MEACKRTLVMPALARGLHVLVEDDYPELLAQAEGSPALFVDGDVSCLHEVSVGIVGTRDASTYGKACAQKFAEVLGRAGVTVVSGGALGIDGAAHRGALNGGGKTAAVLAGGVDHVYPSVHAGLFQQIRAQGCLVSQYALGTRPSDYKFLVRNHLIAALCQAVFVVEAPPKSGALVTAQASAELGRDVFVLPANIDQKRFRGSFNLIRDGATLVYHPNQILEALGVAVPAAAPETPPASSEGERILSVLTVQPISTEIIVERTGLEASAVLSELTMLELDGRVIRDAGGYAVRP